MIQYIEGDIFESPAQVIVNTVNTMGVMGKGLALSFKQRYPKMFESYKATCEKHTFTIGKLMLYYEADHWILLFPTKENWRNPSKLDYVEKGLMKFVNTYAEKNITSIAFPRLGCGNGELNWSDVKPLMEKYLKDLPIDVYIYLGVNLDVVPEHKQIAATAKWLRANAKDMSFVGLKDDLQNLNTLLPYELNYGNEKYQMKFEREMIFSSKASTDNIRVSEESLYYLWDNIRMNAVFSLENSSKSDQLVYALLFETGYLSKIRIFDIKQQKMVSGYQINAGLGRTLAFKGA